MHAGAVLTNKSRRARGMSQRVHLLAYEVVGTPIEIFQPFQRNVLPRLIDGSDTPHRRVRLVTLDEPLNYLRLADGKQR